MGRNKQRFNANRGVETPTNQPVELPEVETDAQDTPVEETETEETEETESAETTETIVVQTPDSTPITEGSAYRLDEQPTRYEDEDTVEEDDDVVEPQVNETVFSNPSVDLEEEQERIRRDQSIGELTQDEVMNKVGLTAKMSLLSIINYVDEMRNVNGHKNIFLTERNFIVNVGPSMQVNLYKNIMDIITKTDDTDFRYAMDFLMQMFVKEGGENGPLSFLSLSRFQENLKLSTVDLKCYPNLMRMLTVLADPVERAKNARSTVDFDRSLEFGFSDAAKSRLINYFSH